MSAKKGKGDEAAGGSAKANPAAVEVKVAGSPTSPPGPTVGPDEIAAELQPDGAKTSPDDTGQLSAREQAQKRPLFDYDPGWDQELGEAMKKAFKNMLKVGSNYNILRIQYLYKEIAALEKNPNSGDPAQQEKNEKQLISWKNELAYREERYVIEANSSEAYQKKCKELGYEIPKFDPKSAKTIGELEEKWKDAKSDTKSTTRKVVETTLLFPVKLPGVTAGLVLKGAWHIATYPIKWVAGKVLGDKTADQAAKESAKADDAAAPTTPANFSAGGPKGMAAKYAAAAEGYGDAAKTALGDAKPKPGGRPKPKEEGKWWKDYLPTFFDRKNRDQDVFDDIRFGAPGAPAAPAASAAPVHQKPAGRNAK